MTNQTQNDTEWRCASDSKGRRYHWRIKNGAHLAIRKSELGMWRVFVNDNLICDRDYWQAARKAADEAAAKVEAPAADAPKVVVHVDRIIRPRIDNGRDFNAERIVLIRSGALELIWRKACRVWGDIVDGYSSEPGRLYLTNGKSDQTIIRGGRLSAAIVKDNADKINAYFGADVAGAIEIRKTLIVERAEAEEYRSTSDADHAYDAARAGNAFGRGNR